MELRIAAYRELLPLVWDATRLTSVALDAVKKREAGKGADSEVEEAVEAAAKAGHIVLRRIPSDVILLAPDSFLTEYQRGGKLYYLHSSERHHLEGTLTALGQLQQSLTKFMRDDIKRRVGKRLWG